MANLHSLTVDHRHRIYTERNGSTTECINVVDGNGPGLTQGTAMRGLETRAAYAMANVLMIIDRDAAAEARCDAIIEADGEGFDDYCAGLADPPVLFVDVPELLRAWQSGWDFAEESVELDNCPTCNDGSGDPCQEHG